ncbi:MAG: hydroxymethylbilane synthase [Chlamydiota bacterium]
MPLLIKVGSRGSALARSQVEEVFQEIVRIHPDVLFDPLWITTAGDKDLQTSLKLLDKTDFFTKEIDALLLSHRCRIAIHSAKDLPEPLPEGLFLGALTKGVDPSDVLVFRDNETLDTLPLGARIGTSSIRREEMITLLRSDLVCVDIRGPVEERLALLDKSVFDGVIMAEAALVRLGLQGRNRLVLPGPTAQLQGQLAVIMRKEDDEMRVLFMVIDSRLL